MLLKSNNSQVLINSVKLIFLHKYENLILGIFPFVNLYNFPKSYTRIIIYIYLTKVNSHTNNIHLQNSTKKKEEL